MLFFVWLLLFPIVTAFLFDTGFDLDHDQPLDPMAQFQAGLSPFKQSVIPPRKGREDYLTEFTPISNTIVQSELQLYSFNVNTSSGLGEYYQLLIFLTGNLCTQPSNVGLNDTSLAVYYSFNASMFTNFELGQMELFEAGYFQALTDVPIVDSSEYEDSVLYIAVRAPENTDRTANWTYQIGVSQNDLVFQWDDRPSAMVVDTDEQSALIVTNNLTAPHSSDLSRLNISKSPYSLLVYSYDYKDYFASLNCSWCAIRDGPALLSSSEINTSYTTRNGGIQQQFYVSNLNSSTKYLAYLVSDFGGNSFGGAIYQPLEFETLDSPACELIYDLEFCDRVAYSVPTNKDGSKDSVKQLYDDQAKNLFTNFSKALQQIACNTTADAVFSPVRTCEDCADSYKDWLCAVTIPRCSTRNVTGYKYRETNDSRNDFILNTIEPNLPYYEVLPCLNVCQAIVADCPADFQFSCPKKNVSIEKSYYFDLGGRYPTCNYVGTEKVVSSRGLRNTVNWLLLLVVVAANVLV
ncbi:uncharacterized protein CANTADRAFT_19081 [Suhomyces tanzawaensis NRRL Y-17324]|uniref:Uncharacterized protein n=1 Tax=Suhomyces tanzawaensis NRRL Y-17324 TaxID=984487 RepID=A0A1E4SPM3_9ASCO|nr:uncharacterized protein CANTADRAFT_19081 [Suhomyces tanzawaensis NRRL Y-17324]ODV81446.1 hypothetical protein CANTADRAFT_19081 [Suhomyces tanzawaensis NRRL Y-17324]